MRGMPTLTRADLASVFEPTGRVERVGLEVECGLVDPATGVSVPYAGAASGSALLDALRTRFAATPVTDGAHLIGIQLPDGAQFSLEMGGALEYSSEPAESVAAAVETADTRIRTAAGVAAEMGIAVLSGSMLPFTPVDQVPWIPKPRVQIMRSYFQKLGEDGSLGDSVMGLTLATQTSFDYVSHQDLLDKLRLHVAAAPIISALFANSPVENGKLTGASSRRMQFWRKIDPRRCGVQGFALRRDADVADIVEWALRLPMIYRFDGHRHVAAPASTFEELLRHGYPDGTWPTPDDWESHLSQVWPHVRVRRTLEVRAPDSLPWPYFSAGPAMWTGLTYVESVRRQALDLLSELTAEQVDLATCDVAEKGLAASIGPYPVHVLARELLRLAHEGLSARVAAAEEPASVLAYLDPLQEVVETGITFADRCADDWNGRFSQRPAAYVAEYRVPAQDVPYVGGAGTASSVNT